MNDNQNTIKELFLLPKEELNFEQIKLLFKMFNFDIQEEELPFIELEKIEKWRIEFTNTKTHEKYSGFYTDCCPEYTGSSTFYGANESFLGQKIIGNDVVRINWFELQGDRFIYDDFHLEHQYVPPFERDRVALFEKAFFQCKNADDKYVLEIQKDYPNSDKIKTFKVAVYDGDLESVCSQDGGLDFRMTEALPKKNIVSMQYGLDGDFDYYETGSPMKRGVNETRYIYGRNMCHLSDYKYGEEVLEDNRMIYGVTHKGKDMRYYGVIAEDGSKPLDKIKPFEWGIRPRKFEEYENSKPKSKIYFEINQYNGNPKYIVIIKTQDGKIKAFIDEDQHNSNAKSYKESITTERLIEYEAPAITEGTLTTEEIKLAMAHIAADKRDKYLKGISRELEIFFERKNERKSLSQLESEISDICNPKLIINFDTDLIVDMIKKQGVNNAISSIISQYTNMFKIDRQSVLNANSTEKRFGRA